MRRFRLHYIRKRKAKPFIRLLLFGIFIILPILCILLPLGIETHPEIVGFAFLNFAGCFSVIWVFYGLFFTLPSLYVRYNKYDHEHTVLKNPNSPQEERSKARIRMRPKLNSSIGRTAIRLDKIGKLILLLWLIINTYVILSDVFWQTSIAENTIDWFTQLVHGN